MGREEMERGEAEKRKLLLRNWAIVVVVMSLAVSISVDGSRDRERNA
jgi:hypothetical protein